MLIEKQMSECMQNKHFGRGQMGRMWPCLSEITLSNQNMASCIDVVRTTFFLTGVSTLTHSYGSSKGWFLIMALHLARGILTCKVEFIWINEMKFPISFGRCRLAQKCDPRPWAVLHFLLQNSWDVNVCFDPACSHKVGVAVLGRGLFL